MKHAQHLGAIAAALLAMEAFAPAMASNYTIGGPNQTHFFVPNWGKNGQTITAIPSLETMTNVPAGPPGSKPAHMVPDPMGDYIFSINHGGNGLSVFDAKSGKFIKQIVTGSNIGGFYVFEDGAWRMLLEPKLGVSYQLYSTLAFNDRLIMGQYPTGRLFEYDGDKITDLKGWPPVPCWR